MFRILIITAVALLAALPAMGASSGVRVSGGRFTVVTTPPTPPLLGACTDGVDCMCDTLNPSSTLLFCEDFESAALYENIEDGWPDGEDLGGTWNRGADSYWENRFGNGDGGLFVSSDGPPTLGTACGFGGFGCSGQKEWCSTAQGALAGVGADCWGPNSNTGARIDIQRSGDFNEEVTDLVLTGGIGASANVLAGNQHLAQRLPAGDFAGKHGDIHLKTGGNGSPSNGTTAVTEVGITMLLAYSSNIGTETDNPIGLGGGTYQGSTTSGTTRMTLMVSTGTLGTPGAEMCRTSPIGRSCGSLASPRATRLLPERPFPLEAQTVVRLRFGCALRARTTGRRTFRSEPSTVIRRISRDSAHPTWISNSSTTG